MKSVRPPLAKASTEAPTGAIEFDEITGDALGQTQTVLDTSGLEVVVK